MAINTTKGNSVKFLGLSETVRESLLKAILGNSTDGKVTVNTAKVCYLGLSSTDPGKDGISEPTDENYKRIKLGGMTTGTGSTWQSDFLTITGTQAINSGVQKEIKFNRSLGAWDAPYKYFFLSNTASGSTGLMAWGELTDPITVDAKNVVPLFEEDKFRLYFPAPGEVEGLVDAAAEDN